MGKRGPRPNKKSAYHYLEAYCSFCEGLFTCVSQGKIAHYRRNGVIYCSTACAKSAKSLALSGRIVSAEVRKASSIRMTENNPMKLVETRAKVSATLRTMGWQPPERGGNGRGLTWPQSLLSKSLGWETEVVVPTSITLREEYHCPKHYKLDVGSRFHKIAIEVDGFSHCSLARKEQDRRKEIVLELLGWKVLRFSNKEVMEDLKSCVLKVQSMILK